jgi:hypothetical protein
MKITASAPEFAVCLDNRGYEASLEFGKLYLVVPDEKAAAHELVRIVDESGESYLFEARRFCPIEVPSPVQNALLSEDRMRNSVGSDAK